MKLKNLSVLLLSTVSYALPSGHNSGKDADLHIPELFSETTTAKIWRVALNLLDEVCCCLSSAHTDSPAPRQISRKGPRYRPLCPRGCFVLDFWLLPGVFIRSARTSCPVPRLLPSKWHRPRSNPRATPRPRSEMDGTATQAGSPNGHPRSGIHDHAGSTERLGTERKPEESGYHHYGGT